MLELKKQTAKVAHLNVREERHGEESVVAVDVKVEVEVSNAFLDTLAPGMRESLYMIDPEQLAGLEPALIKLRYPGLAPLHYEVLITQGELVLHGARKADDVRFQCDVKKAIVLDCKEGGTVELTFQAAVLPDPEQMAPLTALLGRSTKVSIRQLELMPPAEEGAPKGKE